MDILINSFLLVVGTTVGSMLILLRKKPFSYINEALAFAGGVMLTASFTSLILPGVETGGFFKTALGIVLGFVFMGFIERLFPHEHAFMGQEGLLKLRMKRLTLLVIGVIIHNIPEGLSVGISTAYSSKEGLITAFAISIQDIPEGLVVSLPIYALTGAMSTAIMLGFFSGLVEGIFSLAGFLFMKGFMQTLAVGLGFGGGAMLYVTVKEVFPEAYSEGSGFYTTLSFLFGVLVMLFLDTMDLFAYLQKCKQFYLR
ncbi:ZIP family metal transporter [Thermocrinis sp.]|uniref:ZIP family metal transporter n=1 Tax=Thermocrinis sp. TaxID=2024383 RepID=UPI002FDD4665